MQLKKDVVKIKVAGPNSSNKGVIPGIHGNRRKPFLAAKKWLRCIGLTLLPEVPGVVRADQSSDDADFCKMAVGVGFEPTKPLRTYALSKRAH